MTAWSAVVDPGERFKIAARKCSRAVPLPVSQDYTPGVSFVPAHTVIAGNAAILPIRTLDLIRADRPALIADGVWIASGFDHHDRGKQKFDVHLKILFKMVRHNAPYIISRQRPHGPDLRFRFLLPANDRRR